MFFFISFLLLVLLSIIISSSQRWDTIFEVDDKCWIFDHHRGSGDQTTIRFQCLDTPSDEYKFATSDPNGIKLFQTYSTPVHLIQFKSVPIVTISSYSETSISSHLSDRPISTSLYLCTKEIELPHVKDLIKTVTMKSEIKFDSVVLNWCQKIELQIVKPLVIQSAPKLITRPTNYLKQISNSINPSLHFRSSSSIETIAVECSPRPCFISFCRVNDFLPGCGRIQSNEIIQISSSSIHRQLQTMNSEMTLLNFNESSRKQDEGSELSLLSTEMQQSSVRSGVRKLYSMSNSTEFHIWVTSADVKLIREYSLGVTWSDWRDVRDPRLSSLEVVEIKGSGVHFPSTVGGLSPRFQSSKFVYHLWIDVSKSGYWTSLKLLYVMENRTECRCFSTDPNIETVINRSTWDSRKQSNSRLGRESENLGVRPMNLDSNFEYHSIEVLTSQQLAPQQPATLIIECGAPNTKNFNNSQLPPLSNIPDQHRYLVHVTPAYLGDSANRLLVEVFNNEQKQIIDLADRSVVP